MDSPMDLASSIHFLRASRSSEAHDLWKAAMLVSAPYFSLRPLTLRSNSPSDNIGPVLM